jgi:hypothetical protein
MSSCTTLQVVTTGIGYGPYPTPYPVRCRPCAQSRGPGSGTPGNLTLLKALTNVVISGFKQGKPKIVDGKPNLTNPRPNRWQKKV